MNQLLIIIFISIFCCGKLNAQSKPIISYEDSLFVNLSSDSNLTDNSISEKEVEKNRIWLNLTNDKGAFNQILIGYHEEATNGIDLGYDSEVLFKSTITFYSIQSGKNLTIQGRGLPFSDSDTVNLGYEISASNKYTIGIDHLDGLFKTQSIYLEDKLLNVIHDLNRNDYEFTSEAGIFNGRFVLRYTNNALNISNINSLDFKVNAMFLNQQLLIHTSEFINEVSVYDLSGKLIKFYKTNDTFKEFTADFLYVNGIYLVKVKLNNDYLIPIKLVNKN